MNSNLLDDLAEYVNALSTSMQETKHSGDRSAYVKHLAPAALIFQSLQKSNFQQARQQVAEEQRQFGWSFLPGEPGAAAEAAFARFAKSLEEKAVASL